MSTFSTPRQATRPDTIDPAVRTFDALVRAYLRADYQAVGPLRAELVRLGWRVMPIRGPWGADR
jgi:hypothetical protein